MTHREPTVVVTRTTLLPAGADPGDSNAWNFAVDVEYRGENAWAVVRNANQYLSRAGNWAWHPKPFQRRQYRFDTREDALLAAARVLPGVKVAGMTWDQWRKRSAP